MLFFFEMFPFFLNHNHICSVTYDPQIFNSLYAALVRKEDYLLGSSEQQAGPWL